MAAQGAMAAIRMGCEMLSEGKAEVQRVKKAVEEAKAIVAEAKGIWDMLRGIWASIAGLLGAAPKPPSTPEKLVAEPVAAVAAPKAKKSRDEYTEHVPTELEIISKVGENIAKFMRVRSQWEAYYEAEKARIFSGEGMEETQGEAALNLVLIETQFNSLNEELRTMMTFNAPPQLGPLYTRFNEMYKRISEEQALSRERKRIEAQNAKWQREQTYHLRLNRVLALVGVTVGSMMTWGILLSLKLLVETLSGSLG